MSDPGLRDLVRQIALEVAEELRARPSLPLRWLTPEQASTYTGCSLRALEDWRSQGGGPAWVRAGNRLVRYRLEDIDAFLERGRSATPEVTPERVGQ